jgi:hypothetical protein
MSDFYCFMRNCEMLQYFLLLKTSTCQVSLCYTTIHSKAISESLSLTNLIMLAVATYVLIPKVVSTCKDTSAISIRPDNQTVTAVCHISNDSKISLQWKEFHTMLLFHSLTKLRYLLIIKGQYIFCNITLLSDASISLIKYGHTFCFMLFDFFQNFQFFLQPKNKKN